MTVVAVCAAHGGAGSTTTALALASGWPAGDPVLLAELDQSGGDVAAWHNLGRTPGVTSAVVGVRHPSVDELRRHTQELPGGVRVLVGPTRAVEASAAVSEAARVVLPPLRAAPDVVVVADCGRITPAAPSPVPSLATTTVVVVRQDTLSAPRTVGLIEHAAELTEALARVTSVVVVLVGTAPYPAREVESHLGVEIVGVIDHDELAAARLAGRPGGLRTLERSRLVRSSRAVAAALQTRLGRLVTPETPADTTAADTTATDTTATDTLAIDTTAPTPSGAAPTPPPSGPSRNGDGLFRPRPAPGGATR